MTSEDTIDYMTLYNEYWQSYDRIGERSGDLKRLASVLMETCGYGSAIDIGCGEGFLVAELLACGMDAVGLDISAVVVERANKRCPKRFFEGSVLSIPFPEAHFDVVVSTDCMEHLAPSDVPLALREMYRVSSRYVFLQIATTHDRDNHWHLTVEKRAWWEERCFEAGFRKHALYYRANPYEALNEDGWQILVLLEKVPDEALHCYDLNTLDEERLLHTDMLRETGRRSDAHCIRYNRAAEYIRPGDRVLDISCGLGYGSHILYTASQARSVTGVDLSDFAIGYANEHYGRPGAVMFRVGDAQALDFILENSIDFIAAFETIEHVPDPVSYLRELKRILKPSGRIMVSAPNDWTDDTGTDPNPHHLHVYSWERLLAECGEFFLLEQGFIQTAGGAMKCHHSDRKWTAVSVDSVPQEESEWVLVLGMSDPVSGKDIPYVETTWVIPEDEGFHVSAFARDYTNPWLVKGMVSMGMRSRSMALLVSMHERVLASADPESVEYGAALCGRIYALLSAEATVPQCVKNLENDIWRYASIPKPTPHQLRWQVSLLYAGGELSKSQGRLDDAGSFFSECASRDVTVYSPLLGNKVIDALYWLAVFALSRHDKGAARTYLLQSVNKSQQFVSGSWLNVTGKSETPMPFGPAELSQLLDKASRAAYILSVLDSGDSRGGVQCQESVGFFERQLIDRDRRLSDMDHAIRKIQTVLKEKEKICQNLAHEVTMQDEHAQALAREVATQDAHAQSLAREVSERDAEAQMLAGELVVARSEIDRLTATIRKQNLILNMFRPCLWPGIIHRYFAKSGS